VVPLRPAGLKWDEDQERWYVENSDAKGIAVYQQEHKVLKAIAELAPERRSVWVTMMLDLIVRKFWKQGYQAPALSYTGEMIKIEDRLIDEGRDRQPAGRRLPAAGAAGAERRGRDH
jgi:hypothetical protein